MQTVAIIGGGPAALMLAAMLDEEKYSVHIYEKNTSVGRKFLVAGDGGFNLTHSEEIDSFVTRYTPSDFLEQALRTFTNQDLCEWLKGIGIETYTGSRTKGYAFIGIHGEKIDQSVALRALKSAVSKIGEHPSFTFLEFLKCM